jgi:hypothetical protein
VRRGPSIFINLLRNHSILPQHERETSGVAKPSTTITAFASLMLILCITSSIGSMTRREIDVNHRKRSATQTLKENKAATKNLEPHSRNQINRQDPKTSRLQDPRKRLRNLGVLVSWRLGDYKSFQRREGFASKWYEQRKWGLADATTFVRCLLPAVCHFGNRVQGFRVLDR